MSDACPSCGSSLLPDQRYCLSCGQRRGEPRLPIMDAVAYMDASKRPQPAAAAAPPESPPRRRPPISASSSLVAVVATLVLALGVGVLIGRSGDNGATNAAAPQIIRVGGGEETATASTAGAGGGASASSAKGKKADPATVKEAKEKASTGKSGTSKATEEVFEPAPGVKIAPPEQQIGGDCDPSVSGCNSKGEFEGNFFE
ncbi:MAG TPA: hypothetical protein VHP56_13250 [Solirubrobacterales bacterium]|nr:hypothetical protein [Solirubrobacterales bacterium]